MYNPTTLQSYCKTWSPLFQTSFTHGTDVCSICFCFVYQYYYVSDVEAHTSAIHTNVWHADGRTGEKLPDRQLQNMLCRVTGVKDGQSSSCVLRCYTMQVVILICTVYCKKKKKKKKSTSELGGKREEHLPHMLTQRGESVSPVQTVHGENAQCPTVTQSSICWQVELWETPFISCLQLLLTRFLFGV